MERFNRTLKNKVYKYFTKFNTFKYIDALKDIIDSYNATYHRSIKMAPIKVNKENEFKVWRTLYREDALKRILPKLKVGDKVRISKTRHVFQKEYTQNWTEEIFTISKSIPSNPPTYQIADFNGERLKGIFYEEELNHIIKTDNLFVIDKILKRKKINDKIHYLVKWRGYSNEFNSYVEQEAVNNLKL